MRPDWSKSPSWAMYAAQEPSGQWFWHENKPVYREICTEWQSTGQRQIIPKVDTTPKQTLEVRPG